MKLFRMVQIIIVVVVALTAVATDQVIAGDLATLGINAQVADISVQDQKEIGEDPLSISAQKEIHAGPISESDSKEITF